MADAKLYTTQDQIRLLEERIGPDILKEFNDRLNRYIIAGRVVGISAVLGISYSGCRSEEKMTRKKALAILIMAIPLGILGDIIGSRLAFAFGRGYVAKQLAREYPDKSEDLHAWDNLTYIQAENRLNL